MMHFYLTAGESYRAHGMKKKVQRNLSNANNVLKFTFIGNCLENVLMHKRFLSVFLMGK